MATAIRLFSNSVGALAGLLLGPGCSAPIGRADQESSPTTEETSPADVSSSSGDASSSGSGGSSSGDPAASTGGLPPADSSGGGSSSSSGGFDGPPCEAPQPVPAPPVDCTGVDGVYGDNVFIEEDGDTPAVLEGIRVVQGSVRINRMNFTDLEFLACVEEIEGDLTIFGNEQLSDVSGLWSLRSLGTNLVFSDNTALVDFDGLPNLETIGNNLVLQNNAGLTGISGFHRLRSLNNLTIIDNPDLSHVDGLGGLEVVTGVFAVTHNSLLCISSVNCVGAGIVEPAVPPATWSTQANDEGC